jgi:hypothetical protein
MKTQLVLLGLLLPALVGAAEFKEFTSKEGKFTVLMPGAPKEKKQSSTAFGKTFDLYQFSVELGDRAYVAAYQVDENYTKLKPEMIEKTYDSIRDGAVKGFKGKVLSDQKIKLADKSAREFQVTVPDIGVYRSRVVIIGNRMYQVSVLAPKDVALSKESDKFLDSLKLTMPETP